MSQEKFQVVIDKQYRHREEDFVVTVTSIKHKTLGTKDKPIYRTLVYFTRSDDGTKMMTELATFDKNYQLLE